MSWSITLINFLKEPKLPNKITVGGHDITVTWGKDLKAHDGEAAWGLYGKSDNTIEIADDLKTKQSQVVEVLLHELLHAMIFEGNLQTYLKSKEEHVVDVLAKQMTIMFKQNPDLLKFIGDNLGKS